MTRTARYRLYFDLASSLLGVLAGLLFVFSGVFGLPAVEGVAAPVAVMGLFGAAFSAVGVGHLYLEDDVRGAGEFVAGVVTLVGGGLIVLADSFGVGP